MSSYKVSAIVSFNPIQQIEKTFESIKNQSFGFDDIELIFIANHSTAESIQVLTSLANEFENVEFYELQGNQNTISNYYNKGIESASGEYLVFLDGGDTFDYEFIEKVYDEISANNLDIVKTSYYYGINEKKSYSRNLGRVIVPHDNLSILLSYYNYLEPWATIYRRNFLIDNDIRFIDVYNPYELFLFEIECLTKTNNDIILLDDYEGYCWNHEIEELSDIDIPVEQLSNVIENFTKMIYILMEDNQPKECIETFLPFVLSFCGSSILNSRASKDELASFLYKAALGMDVEEMADGQKVEGYYE